MPFKKPKGDIWWWSIFWLIGGLWLSVYGPLKSDMTMSILGPVMVAIVVFIWLGHKWIAPPLMILNGIGFILRVMLLIGKGFTWAGFFRLILPLYTIYLLWDWYKSEDEPRLPLSFEPRSPTSPFETEPDDDRWSNPYQGNRSDEQ